MGWTAVIGTGLVLGLLVAVFTKAPLLAALPGGVALVWATLVLLDRHRDRNMETNMAIDNLDPETGAALVETLRKANIKAAYYEFEDEWEGEPYTERGIRCRNADVDEARRIINAYRS